MQKLKYFSGIKPTVEDLEFDQDGKGEAIIDRQKEMFSDGVVEGFLFREDSPGEYFLEPGLAYVSGERIEISESQVVSITASQDDQFIFLKFETELSHPVQHFVSSETFNIYQSDSFSIQIRDTATPEGNDLLIGMLNLSGITDLREMIWLRIDDRMHEQNTDTGTSAAEFRIGIGDPDHPEGLPALTVDPTPEAPLHPRIEAILPDAPLHRMLPANSDLSTVLGTQSGYATVIFSWNFREISGTAVNSYTFRIEDSEGYRFEADELQDYYIRFYEAGDFTITGNQSTEVNYVSRHIIDLDQQSDLPLSEADLEKLGDNSVVDLHRHSKLTTPSGSPDPALYIDIDGKTHGLKLPVENDMSCNGDYEVGDLFIIHLVAQGKYYLAYKDENGSAKAILLGVDITLT